jgi:glutamate racemase
LSLKRAHLGIIDWGIGGISIEKLIKQEMPDMSVTYFSDTGVTPYGKMKRGELAARLDEVIDYLGGRGVSHVVIGCNAASTAIPFLKTRAKKIEGVIDVAVSETLKQKPARLGLIGGRRTVVSGVYRRAFAAKGVAVRQRIAQPLSGLIESGDLNSDELREQCRHILRPLRRSTHIVLACTHYAAIVDVLGEMVSPETIFIDPAPALAAKVKAWRLAPGGDDIYLTTGDPRQMRLSARAAFGREIGPAEKITL